jgi:hypothetical protein
MHVIGHEHIGMHLALAVSCGSLQRMQVKRVVLSLKEHRLSVDTPRYDMLWNVGNKVSWLTGHPGIVSSVVSSSRCSKMRFDPISAACSPRHSKEKVPLREIAA